MTKNENPQPPQPQSAPASVWLHQQKNQDGTGAPCPSNSSSGSPMGQQGARGVIHSLDTWAAPSEFSDRLYAPAGAAGRAAR